MRVASEKAPDDGRTGRGAADAPSIVADIFPLAANARIISIHVLTAATTTMGGAGRREVRGEKAQEGVSRRARCAVGEVWDAPPGGRTRRVLLLRLFGADRAVEGRAGLGAAKGGHVSVRGGGGRGRDGKEGKEEAEGVHGGKREE